MPEIETDNLDILQVFLMVKDQYIMGAGGPIALNLDPVFKTMNILKIQQQDRCLTMIKKMHNAMIEKLRND